MGEPIRIAMWSGPRNISTAMMRSFENRPDTAVVDEPFYAAYLIKTGLDHPMRDAVLMSQPLDWRRVADALTGPVPQGRAVFYQKHMTHHMLSDFGRDWIRHCRNAFLIRAPEAVLASYTEKRPDVTLDDIGFRQQQELFDRECQRLGTAPPVIDSADVLRDPRATLTALCTALGIPFTDQMLHWPAGRRDSDGVWATAWYDSVEKSTGFVVQHHERRPRALSPELMHIADQAQPHYAALEKFRLR
ncbi:MAG TPA: hypothetical protein VHL34_18125 [Rhizomicrobium sp.]|jgi:hypothetical protein|nr:hypothetical protein [Rhizomicrobium sp.]